ncbi:MULTISPECIES: autotransporter domain-containing protein [unclassified Bosea (in: a-proteobacteria)]|uniref:autotransporter outer membrane beta-barrel domain-containing protein n=1 Tax=unclassified Bosea (in: a-proteobacteria) TaxID=2653178 RepID=UPI0012F1026D|nr:MULTISPECIES: autotransporter domain-containing protein [unclassified Bosea (in: a-proteobacteria)]VXC34499.1 Outer membrane autotransporter barrel domain-containing protein [Bosea sp. 127]
MRTLGRRIACIAFALDAGIMACLSVSGSAQAAGTDATWLYNPPGANTNEGQNWSTGTVPTGTGYFGTSARTEYYMFSTHGGFTFNADAPAYRFRGSITFDGAGIVNNSSNTQTFEVFRFNGMYFLNSASAGNAHITSDGAVVFRGTSTAADSNISSRDLRFQDDSTAGNATIRPYSLALFEGHSTAGDATIIVGFSTAVSFSEYSTGGNARFVVSGELAILSLTTAGMTAGSIEGAGTVELGSKQLTVGSNNLSTTFSGAIIDSEGNFYRGGSLVKVGSGTLTLTGANSYTGGTTVSGGTLAGTTTSLQGAIQVDAALVFDQSNTGTYAGVLSGAGSVTKRGSGVVTFTGSSSFTGQTSVEAGTLSVNGSLAGSTVVVNGGTLGGAGTVGGIAAVSGTVAPGNSIGTLTVAGNVSLGSASTYRVEVDASGQSDRIVASGMATLSGGTVQVVAANGDYNQVTRYTILTAQGGVSGQFSAVTSDLAFLTPSLSYGATDVTLTMARNDRRFGGTGYTVATTANQSAVGVVAETLGNGNRVYEALIGSTVAEARTGLSLLAGEAHAANALNTVADGNAMRDALLSHTRLPPGAAGPGVASWSADGPGGVLAGSASRSNLAAPRFSAWGTAIGYQGRSDGTANAGAMRRNGGGFLVGGEVAIDETWRLGAAAGYTRSHFDIATRATSGSSDNVHAALYGAARFGGLNLTLGAAVSWSAGDIDRRVAFRNFGESLTSSPGGMLAQTFLDVGYRFDVGRFGLEPFAQVVLLNLQSDRVTETGGSAALAVASGSQWFGLSTLGLRTEIRLGGGPLFARSSLAWRHSFGEVTPTALAAFSSGSSSFRVASAQADRDAAVVEAGLDWRGLSSVNLGVSYGGVYGANARDHTLRGKVEIRF